MPIDQRARSTYRLISSDGHIVEPPDVWVDRVPAKYRDRCPRIEPLPEGDAWIIDGADGEVPREERELMLAGNAQRLYKFGQ